LKCGSGGGRKGVFRVEGKSLLPASSAFPENPGSDQAGLRRHDLEDHLPGRIGAGSGRSSAGLRLERSSQRSIFPPGRMTGIGSWTAATKAAGFGGD
jgi:hypothetical protein